MPGAQAPPLRRHPRTWPRATQLADARGPTGTAVLDEPGAIEDDPEPLTPPTPLRFYAEEDICWLETPVTANYRLGVVEAQTGPVYIARELVDEAREAAYDYNELVLPITEMMDMASTVINAQRMLDRLVSAVVRARGEAAHAHTASRAG